MLEQILHHIHNYFEKEIIDGTFEITSGVINLPFLQNGQYFRIEGSVFNDGIYEYDSNLRLTDERFNGKIWAMAVPPAVIALSTEIEQWVNDNKSNLTSPFLSESFGGYSYSKGSKSSVSGANVPINWTDVFADRLNHWRKIG